MNKKYIDNLLPQAIETIKNNARIYDNTNHSAHNEFIGYISGFAIAVSQSGVRQAILFYSKQGSAKYDRRAMLEVLGELMNDNLVQKAESNTTLSHEFKQNLLDTSVAFKMALRTLIKK